MKKIATLFKIYQSQLQLLLNIILLLLCLRLFYSFLTAIWLASTTNTFATLKDFSLKDIGNGILITGILSFILYIVNSTINTFCEHSNHLLRDNSITFLIMIFLLISFSIEQFNIVTGILATFVLIQSSVTSKMFNTANQKHYYNRKFPKKTYKNSRRSHHK